MTCLYIFHFQTFHLREDLNIATDSRQHTAKSRPAPNLSFLIDLPDDTFSFRSWADAERTGTPVYCTHVFTRDVRH